MTPKIQKAISFATRAHQGQFRKDGETPYVGHVIRVAFTGRQIFDVADETTIAAAVLHDTLEDTTTDYDDLIELFGPEIADLVVHLTKDPRLIEEVREKQYFDNLTTAPWQARLIKLADAYDNLLDSQTSTVPTKAIEKAEHALALAQTDEPELARARAALSDLIQSTRVSHS